MLGKCWIRERTLYILIWGFPGAGTGALPGAGVSSLLTVVFTLPRFVAARKTPRLSLI